MRIGYLAMSLCCCLGCRGLLTSADITSSTLSNPLPARRASEDPRPDPRLRPEWTLTRHAEPLADDALNLAAACIQKGDSPGAADQLNRHIMSFPDQIMIRAYLAELLLKAKKLPDAQDHFERFIAAAQDSDGPAKQQLLHCHTRLMEIAQERDDGYGEHLHRGIGMVLLVRQLDGNKIVDEAEPGFRERLLCKAAAELTKAKKVRPDEPRPLCYLVEVWTKLNQPRSAENALKEAKRRAALLPLPPSEYKSLVFAK